MLWARILQGIGLAPFEALVNATVGDMYFVHERGKRMAISNFAVFGGAFMTPVVVGKMAHTLGWRWSFWFIAIFAGAFLPVLVFFVPETAYRRSDYLNSDTVIGLQGTSEQEPKPDLLQGTTNRASGSTHGDMEKIEPPANEAQALSELTSPPQRVSYWKTLSPFNGRKTDESYWKLLLRPLPLYAHPGILWACLIQGTLIGWTVFLGIVLAAIMLGPPLFFNEVKTGYMYTGAFIGAVVGFLIAGVFADSIPNWMTRRNRGVYEPEFRLPLVIPQLVLGCAGLYGFGITAENTGRYGWFWPDFFFALEVAGMVVGAVASSLYIVDAHRMFTSLAP
jgi:MFS family permease